MSPGCYLPGGKISTVKGGSASRQGVNWFSKNADSSLSGLGEFVSFQRQTSDDGCKRVEIVVNDLSNPPSLRFDTAFATSVPSGSFSLAVLPLLQCYALHAISGLRFFVLLTRSSLSSFLRLINSTLFPE